MERKSPALNVVIIGVLLIGLFTAQTPVDATSCCESTKARNSYSVCRLRLGASKNCAKLTGCIIIDGTSCPSDYPIGMTPAKEGTTKVIPHTGSEICTTEDLSRFRYSRNGCEWCRNWCANKCHDMLGSVSNQTSLRGPPIKVERYRVSNQTCAPFINPHGLHTLKCECCCEPPLYPYHPPPPLSPSSPPPPLSLSPHPPAQFLPCKPGDVFKFVLRNSANGCESCKKRCADRRAIMIGSVSNQTCAPFTNTYSSPPFICQCCRKPPSPTSPSHPPPLLKLKNYYSVTAIIHNLVRPTVSVYLQTSPFEATLLFYNSILLQQKN